MGRLSRGCLRCRQRRVRCDEERPSCRRCINRDEVCEGYRDESTLIFRHETAKVIELATIGANASSAQEMSHSSLQSQLPASPRKRSRSVGATSCSVSQRRGLRPDPSDLDQEMDFGVRPGIGRPWLKAATAAKQAPVEEQAVDQFMDRYVLYPCNQTSLPGFLEHLPSMFKEVNINGRYALRWAVRAAAYADASRDQEGNVLASKALQCYGMSLRALGESLSEPGKVPDDYDLMTVVVLDIFETLHTPEQARKGSHVQGMAQMLRLRGSDLVYSSRGWSLFRLANHRIQKQQLAFNMSHSGFTPHLFDQLNEDEPFVRLEKSTHDLGETCERGRTLLARINAGGLPARTLVDMIRDLHSLDEAVVSWRQTSQWSFVSVPVSKRPDLALAAEGITDTIQLHSDVWLAYEWNYHRTARIIFLQQILHCARAALDTPDLGAAEESALKETMAECISTVHWLADEILATVPQSFGDIDHMGRLHNTTNGPPKCRAIGGYLLLWSTRTVKGTQAATTPDQKQRAQRVFERIREYTGMKDFLGDKSIV